MVYVNIEQNNVEEDVRCDGPCTEGVEDQGVNHGVVPVAP